MVHQYSAYPLDYSTTQASPEVRTNDTDRTVGNGADEIVGQLAEQAEAYARRAQEALENFRPYVQQQMKERPMATLTAAAAIGLLLGAMWKR